MRQGLSRRDLITKSLASVAAFAAARSGSNLLAQTVRKESLDLTPNDVCTPTCSKDLGPCYYNGVVERQDITEGLAGLPTLLSFQVVNADTCQPIEGAIVDIWHAGPEGVYSAPITTFCTGNNAAARAATYLRGYQRSDSNGWVHFNTVYPGWYSGNNPHPRHRSRQRHRHRHHPVFLPRHRQ